MPTPEADVPVPPLPQQAGGTDTPPQQAGAPQEDWRQRHPILTGCLAIIVLLVFLGILGATLGGGGDEQVSSPPERAEQDEGLEGGGPDPEANQPLQGEKAKQQGGQQQEQAVEEPKPITFSGSGPQATRLFQLEQGLTVIRMSHQGGANFIVDLLDQNGNSVAPMGAANVIGPFEGSTPVQIARDGQHLLDVQAGGQWQITVEQPRAANAPERTSFSGNSQQATQLFELSGGLHRVRMTHQGSGNFIVDLLNEDGASVTPMGLANEIGPFEGSRAMQVPEDGIYLFSVLADGPWTIQIE